MHPELTSTYVLARSPKNEKEMVFVERVSFLRLTDFYTYDLLNGLHHGHAPSQCLGCGRYFLTSGSRDGRGVLHDTAENLGIGETLCRGASQWRTE